MILTESEGVGTSSSNDDMINSVAPAIVISVAAVAKM